MINEVRGRTKTWVGYKTRTSRFMRVCWRKIGLPLLTEKIANKIWTTMTWAVSGGDVPFMLALRENDCMVEKSVLLGYDRDGSSKLGSTPEVYSGTHRWRDGLVKGRTGYNS